MRDINRAIALIKSLVKHPIRAIPLLIGIGLVFFGAQNYEPPTEPNEARSSAVPKGSAEEIQANLDQLSQLEQIGGSPPPPTGWGRIEISMQLRLI